MRPDIAIDGIAQNKRIQIFGASKWATCASACTRYPCGLLHAALFVPHAAFQSQFPECPARLWHWAGIASRETRAIIFDDELVARHYSALVPAGTAKPRRKVSASIGPCLRAAISSREWHCCAGKSQFIVQRRSRFALPATTSTSSSFRRAPPTMHQARGMVTGMDMIAHQGCGWRKLMWASACRFFSRR